MKLSKLNKLTSEIAIKVTFWRLAVLFMLIAIGAGIYGLNIVGEFSFTAILFTVILPLVFWFNYYMAKDKQDPGSRPG